VHVSDQCVVHPAFKPVVDRPPRLPCFVLPRPIRNHDRPVGDAAGLAERATDEMDEFVAGDFRLSTVRGIKNDAVGTAIAEWQRGGVAVD